MTIIAPFAEYMNEHTRDIDQLMADERNLRLLINNMENPMWLVSTDHTIIECNDAFKKWVCCFVGQEIGKGDNVLYNGQNIMYQQKFEMCYQLALSGKAFMSVEDMMVNNEQRYTHVTFTPVADAGASIIAVSCFARDITEHRMHLLHIEQQNTALREIAFIESHKIRGPVATILGLEQFYNYHDDTDPMNREIMTGIKEMSLQLDVRIREVVKMSNEIDMAVAV